MSEEQKEPFSNEVLDIPKLDKKKEDIKDSKKVFLISMPIIFILFVLISIAITLSSSSDEITGKFTAIYITNNGKENIRLFNKKYSSYFSSIKINGNSANVSDFYYLEKVENMK